MIPFYNSFDTSPVLSPLSYFESLLYIVVPGLRWELSTVRPTIRNMPVLARLLWKPVGEQQSIPGMSQINEHTLITIRHSIH